MKNKTRKKSARRKKKNGEKNLEVKRDEEIKRCREKNERERAMERRGMVDDVPRLASPHLPCGGGES